ncbi:hypothetical protein K490DRAFT_36403 [Saccharata proteae CBS 121410]|uniref:SMP-LTD domain-containing protein n=1 Tax=Saccharata proteae CBS 121410 TaxID=1314787 RepID=A0A9P4LWW2_9PEZI|nr:hypothetical protein K490DRAFT_36403 [Saccharata proteae CBS 121410]
MVTLKAFLLIYSLGAFTFVPFVAALLICHAYFTLPRRSSTSSSERRNPTSAAEDPAKTASDTGPALPEFKAGSHEPDVAAGYFAVCREYVPGGVNGKPPERTTPAGTTVGAQSPSVYQSMYRSLFDRNRTTSPSLDAGNGKTARKARNVFFVVLRHGHLVLFDDAEQLEVRHVISLANRSVDVYAGGGSIPEGELWIKRNCIRLTSEQSSRKSDGADPSALYLFSENTSEKEDFYLALVQNQERKGDGSASSPLYFHTAHIVKLVQQLHASEDHLQTRWINALAGRLFLALYKTEQIKDFIRMKITKKIARVSKPAFLQSVSIRHIDMGDSVPLLTNPKLRELTVDGDFTAEFDVSYNGNFGLEIAAVARIDLGSRFKARHVNLVLAGILKKLEGHVLIRVKPPPSNRLWMTFEFPPKLDMSIEPVVSSRQITYGFILRAIENRIREVISETLVMPNWDDIPFHDSALQTVRGGIWTNAAKPDKPSDMDEDANHEEFETAINADGLPAHQPISSVDAPNPEIALAQASPASSPVIQRRLTTSAQLPCGNREAGVASGIDTRSHPNKPKPLRSGSFATAAFPVVNRDPAVVGTPEKPTNRERHDAAAAMKDISSRSQPGSPAESPVGSPVNGILLAKPRLSRKSRQDISEVDDQCTVDTSDPFIRSLEGHLGARTPEIAGNPSMHSVAGNSAIPQNTTASSPSTFGDRRQSINASLTSATTAAKKWLVARQKDAQPSSSSNTSADIPHPMGRGQPLPPPGTPLPLPPRPERKWGPNPLAGLTKRKPIPPPLPQRPMAQDFDKVDGDSKRTGSDAGIVSAASHASPPCLPPRTRPDHYHSQDADSEGQGPPATQGLLVVAAPVADPTPTSGGQDSESLGEGVDILTESAVGMEADNLRGIPAEGDSHVMLRLVADDHEPAIGVSYDEKLN